MPEAEASQQTLLPDSLPQGLEEDASQASVVIEARSTPGKKTAAKASAKAVNNRRSHGVLWQQALPACVLGSSAAAAPASSSPSAAEKVSKRSAGKQASKVKLSEEAAASDVAEAEN